MSIELLMLVVGGLLSLGLAMATVVIQFSRYGGKTIRGNREDFPALSGAALRVVRAHANLNEALLPFAILVLAAAALHVSTPVTVYAALAFLAARLAHAALYLAGATPWRSLAFYVGLLATLVFASQLPLATAFAMLRFG